MLEQITSFKKHKYAPGGNALYLSYLSDTWLAEGVKAQLGETFTCFFEEFIILVKKVAITDLALCAVCSAEVISGSWLGPYLLIEGIF